MLKFHNCAIFITQQRCLLWTASRNIGQTTQVKDSNFAIILAERVSSLHVDRQSEQERRKITDFLQLTSMRAHDIRLMVSMWMENCKFSTDRFAGDYYKTPYVILTRSSQLVVCAPESRGCQAILATSLACCCKLTARIAYTLVILEHTQQVLRP